MAKLKILKRHVIAHKWREPGEVVEVDDNMARMLTELNPESFEWTDRPVQQFVDVVEPPAVAPSKSDAKPARSRSKKKTAETDEDGDESAA